MEARWYWAVQLNTWGWSIRCAWPKGHVYLRGWKAPLPPPSPSPHYIYIHTATPSVFSWGLRQLTNQILTFPCIFFFFFLNPPANEPLTSGTLLCVLLLNWNVMSTELSRIYFTDFGAYELCHSRLHALLFAVSNLVLTVYGKEMRSWSAEVQC